MSCDTGTITQRVPRGTINFLRPTAGLVEHSHTMTILGHPRTATITCAPQPIPSTLDRRLLEDGAFRLLEDGGFRLLE